MFENPGRVIALSFGFMLFGCTVPFLITIHLIKSTYFLNFLSFGLSVLGLLLSMPAIASYRVRYKQRDKNMEDDQHK
jgi:uncharacterized membrane protein